MSWTTGHILRVGGAFIALATALVARPAAATTTVCVSVEEKSFVRPSSPSPGAPARASQPQKPSGPAGREPAAGGGSSEPPDTIGRSEEPVDPTDATAEGTAGADDTTENQPWRKLFSSSEPADEDQGEPEPERDPHQLDPRLTLRRLIEYEVTHEVGFEAVQQGCQQRIVVELYELKQGWTVFGRYSGHAREEKVEMVEFDEFDALAQRLTWALLRDRPIEKTITRTNVLHADSDGKLTTIGVQGHALFALGTSLRGAVLPTADDPDEPAREQLRLLTPVSAQLGYRGKFRAWGIDAFARLNIGTRESSVQDNPLGGHTDYDGGASLGLHSLYYLTPEGMTSFYFGGGASFEVSLFSVIRAQEESGDDRAPLFGGGLDLDAIVGYEFMRASSVHFMAQLELHAPAYVLNAENEAGAIYTYMPGAVALIGAAF